MRCAERRRAEPLCLRDSVRGGVFVEMLCQQVQMWSAGNVEPCGIHHRVDRHPTQTGTDIVIHQARVRAIKPARSSCRQLVEQIERAHKIGTNLLP